MAFLGLLSLIVFVSHGRRLGARRSGVRRSWSSRVENARIGLRWYPALGIVGWFAAGALAWLLGGYGILDPGEIGRWLSLSAFAIVPCALEDLGERELDRLATGFIAALFIATVFSLLTVSVNVRPGEWWVRGASSGFHQGRMPGAWDKTVAGGFYFHRLIYAHVLVIGICALLARQVTVSMRFWRRSAELAMLACLSVGLFLTYARAALVGVFVAALVLALLIPGRARWGLFALGLIAAVSVAAIPSVRARVLSGLAAQASTERSLIWSQAVRIASEHPMGIGLGNYPRVVSEYYDVSQASFPTRTYGHNMWLTTWAETGPLGVVSFFGGMLWVAWCALGERRRPIAAMLIAMVVCLLTIGLTHDTFYHPPVAMSWSAVLAYLSFRLQRTMELKMERAE